MSVTILPGDCREVMPTLGAGTFDSCVTDPPYHLTSIVKRFGSASMADDTKTSERTRAGADGYARAARGFMGKQWDGGDVAFQPETWAEVFRLLKPGAHLLAFGGTRTFHRMAVAIEDAGFEIRDCVSWLYGSGFPKSHDVSKGIDKAAGAEREVVGPGTRHNSKRCAVAHGDTERLAGGVPDITAPATKAARQWQGWGTALKPAWEPVILARKPLVGTVAANVLAHGTGALNVDACRIGTTRSVPASHSATASSIGATGFGARRVEAELNPNLGRWPANCIHDGSEEVLQAFAAFGSAGGGFGSNGDGSGDIHRQSAYGMRHTGETVGFGDTGTAARFFYSAKADASDRLHSKHPTVKPLDLMRYLCRLVTPPGGLILDPFAGSGTTGMAAMAEGFRAVLIEREPEYVEDIKRRIAHVTGADAPLFARNA